MKRKAFMKLLGGAAPAYMLGTARKDAPAPRSREEERLQQHSIRDIQMTTVRLHYPRKVGRNARLDVHGTGPRVRVAVLETDKGARGWGMTRGGSELLQQQAAKLKGRGLSEVFRPAEGVTAPEGIPFDIALHDLAGIILKKPVYELMGRTEPLTTNCYSGMIYFDDLDPQHEPSGIDRILEECRYDYDYGYRQFKLKIGRGNRWMKPEAGLKRDIEVTRAVAESFPDCDILVDANNGYTLETTQRYLEGIGDTPLFWFEEPFDENESDYAALRSWLINRGTDVLLADGEFRPDLEQLKKLYRRRLLDVHLTDIIGYGFTPWRKLMPQLMKMGASASPHAWGSLFKTYYICHLVGAYGNAPTIEGVTCGSEEVDFGSYRLEGGILTPSPEPGFGMKLRKEI